MALHGFLQGYRGYADTQALGNALRALQEEGLDQLPLPGSGQTLSRLSQLAQVAGHDLRLCKLFEGHTDALAIIAELDSPLPPLGSFQGKVTSHTDGVALHGPTKRFPGGVLYAVHDDKALAAFDLREVARTLRIAPTCLQQ